MFLDIDHGNTDIEYEGEHGTGERKGIGSWTSIMATHAYMKNPESPLRRELDLWQWDTDAAS